MKDIKDFILEGNWGYEPNDGDGPLDLRGDFFLSFCELIYDKCEEKLLDEDTGCAWEAIGNIEYFFEELTKLKDFPLKSDLKYEKYYYWFKLIDKKQKNIIETYSKCLDKCKNDENWIEDWKEPKKMRKSLEKREKKLQEYQKLLDEKMKHDQEPEQTQNDGITKDAEAN